jgi:hypothetical protein
MCPIVLEPNLDEQSQIDYYNYPPNNKVLSGTIYGLNNTLTGSLDPKDHIDNYDGLVNAYNNERKRGQL